MLKIILGIIGLIFVATSIALVVASFKAKTTTKSVMLSISSWVAYIISIYFIYERFSTNEISVEVYNQYRTLDSVTSFLFPAGFIGVLVALLLGISLKNTKAKIPVRMLIVFFLCVAFSGLFYGLEAYIGKSRISESEENAITYTRTELVSIEKDKEYYISDFVDITSSSDYFMSTVFWSNENESDKYVDIDLDVKNNSFHVDEDHGILSVVIVMNHPITPGAEIVTCNVEVE